MKKNRWIIVGILMVSIATYFGVKSTINSKKIDFTFTQIEKGSIDAVVSSTGKLKAINTVEIGTQISGTIKKIYVDYNDQVKKGQLLAEMDLKLLETNLVSALANLAVNEARLDQAKDDFLRNTELFKEEVIPEKEFLNSKYNYQQTKSAKEASLAAVNNIKVSMGYAHITSPISGTVTERSVEEGQTVAAAFSTPRMFIVAEDLSKMQILADVDESDIGYIKTGIDVRFTVQTFPEKYFYGKVSQIRLQPIEINNVVNYQVVIDVENKEGLLLPGMTTSIEFILKTAKNVLLINNSAFRFKPNEYMLKEVKPILKKNAEKYFPDSTRVKLLKLIENEALYTPDNYKKEFPKNIEGVFYKNSKSKIDFKFIEIGVKTGLQSEIKRWIDGVELSENTEIINGIKSE
ncbi:efflux RND transporter periplasmic adaptor subunit [Lutibacter sp.]|uniref:efflux RND transporter periplasmic adaptor subunit n=1 Tax=Lutibacter sp. TaxID=1925666 RepID=UPI003565ED9D